MAKLILPLIKNDSRKLKVSEGFKKKKKSFIMDHIQRASLNLLMALKCPVALKRANSDDQTTSSDHS